MKSNTEHTNVALRTQFQLTCLEQRTAEALWTDYSSETHSWIQKTSGGHEANRFSHWLWQTWRENHVRSLFTEDSLSTDI